MAGHPLVAEVTARLANPENRLLIIVVDCSNATSEEDLANLRDLVLPAMLGRTAGVKATIIKFSTEAETVCQITDRPDSLLQSLSLLRRANRGPADFGAALSAARGVITRFAFSTSIPLLFLVANGPHVGGDIELHSLLSLRPPIDFIGFSYQHETALQSFLLSGPVYSLADVHGVVDALNSMTPKCVESRVTISFEQGSNATLQRSTDPLSLLMTVELSSVLDEIHKGTVISFLSGADSFYLPCDITLHCSASHWSPFKTPIQFYPCANARKKMIPIPEAILYECAIKDPNGRQIQKCTGCVQILLAWFGGDFIPPQGVDHMNILLWGMPHSGKTAFLNGLVSTFHSGPEVIHPLCSYPIPGPITENLTYYHLGSLLPEKSITSDLTSQLPIYIVDPWGFEPGRENIAHFLDGTVGNETLKKDYDNEPQILANPKNRKDWEISAIIFFIPITVVEEDLRQISYLIGYAIEEGFKPTVVCNFFNDLSSTVDEMKLRYENIVTKSHLTSKDVFLFENYVNESMKTMSKDLQYWEVFHHAFTAATGKPLKGDPKIDYLLGSTSIRAVITPVSNSSVVLLIDLNATLYLEARDRLIAAIFGAVKGALFTVILVGHDRAYVLFDGIFDLDEAKQRLSNFPLDQSAANLSLGATELLKVISTKSSAVSCIVITKSTTATNSVETLHSMQVSVGPKNLVLIITEPSDDSEQQSLLGSSERTIYLKHNNQCTNVEYTLKNVLEAAVECPFVVEAIFQPNGTTPSHQQNLFFPLKFQVTIYHKPGWANIQSRSIFKIEGNDFYVGQSCPVPHPISQEHPFRKTLLLDVPPQSRGVISPLPGQITFTITHGNTCFEGAFILPIGSNAAVFKVKFQTTTTSNNSITSSTTTSTSSSTSLTSHVNVSDSTVAKTRDMVMKIIFNWENTPQETLSRSKYMAECLVLSSFPNHPNVIHPLGALVIPCLPAEFVEKIPSDKIYFREQLCNNKSLAILMPYCGITLSSFFSSNSSNNMTAEAARDLFVQGLHAIYHIELHFVVHRDIKGDNILIDPETGKLTLIDFGEAQHCPNMEALMSAMSQAWGNPGTMPPELSIFLRRITTETSGVFSYSKCDSFALALTFWNTLLPQTNRFIGSTMNHDMSTFNTQSLLSHFPVPLFSLIGSPSQQHLRAESPQPQTQPPRGATSRHQRNNVLESVMIGMMNPDKAARLSAAEALQSLTL